LGAHTFAARIFISRIFRIGLTEPSKSTATAGECAKLAKLKKTAKH
jgi:hypothetical protein